MDSEGILASILLVTGEMRNIMFDKFSEVLMMDGTYRVNKLKMPSYNFLVADGHD